MQILPEKSKVVQPNSFQVSITQISKSDKDITHMTINASSLNKILANGIQEYTKSNYYTPRPRRVYHRDVGRDQYSKTYQYNTPY